MHITEIPVTDNTKILAAIAGGSPPDMLHLLPGCPFTPRCPLAIAVCPRVMPPLLELETPEHRAACWVTVGGTDRAQRPEATGAARG